MIPTCTGGVNIDMPQVNGNILDIGSGDERQQGAKPGKLADQPGEILVRQAVTRVDGFLLYALEHLARQRFHICGGKRTLTGRFSLAGLPFFIENEPPALVF